MVHDLCSKVMAKKENLGKKSLYLNLFFWP